MNHYYTDNSDLSSERKEFTYYFDNEVFRFTTDNGVFSKDNVDYGSYILIRRHLFKGSGKDAAGPGFGVWSHRDRPETFPSGNRGRNGRGQSEGC